MKVLAAFIFFTRLPFWRIKEVPAKYFKRIVPYWPLAGWLTGGITVGVLWIAAQILPISIAWVLAILYRLLITGCLHEDGMDDFFGSYGVIGLIVYFLLLFLLLENLPLKLICVLVICGDCWSKFCASQIINYLPYARKEEESKAKNVYDRMTWQELLTGFICGFLPIILFLPIDFWPVMICPILTFTLLYRLMKRRLQGYTGDCCGATFLLCELSFYLGALILLYAHIKYGNPNFINVYLK